MTEADRLLYRLIQARGMLAEAKLAEAAEAADEAGISLEEALIVRGFLTEDQLDALEGLARSGSDSMNTLSAGDVADEARPDFTADPLLGQEVGGVRLDRVLGEGGMGRVYQGEDVALGRIVAFKMLTRAFAQRADQVERFKREARSAARLEHPNVVQVYRVGEHEGQHYIVMQFVEGESLIEQLKRDGAMGAIEATKMLLEMVRGMEVAHENEVIHRDIKPDNIMVTIKGEVKIADFGLARESEAQSEISQTGQVLGTPYYMSPEQADGQPVDARTDIYSLGATYYHMLTGRRPFEGDTPLQVMLKHLREDPLPPHKARRTVPEGASRLCLLMMEKKPYDRPESCEALEGEIKALLRAMGEDVDGTTIVQTKKGGKALLFTVVVLLLAAAGVGYLWIQAQQFEKDAAAALKLVKNDADKLTGKHDFAGAAALVRKKKQEFADWKDAGKFDVLAKALDKAGVKAWDEARSAAEQAGASALEQVDPAGLTKALSAWERVEARLSKKSAAAGKKSRAALKTVAAAVTDLAGVRGALPGIAGGGDPGEAPSTVTKWAAEDQPAKIRAAADAVAAELKQAQGTAGAMAAATAKLEGNALDEAAKTIAPFATDAPFAAKAVELRDQIAEAAKDVNTRWGAAAEQARGLLQRLQFSDALTAVRAFDAADRHRGVGAVIEAAGALAGEIAAAKKAHVDGFAAVRAKAAALAGAGDSDGAAKLLQPYLDSDAGLAGQAKAVLAAAGYAANTPEGFAFVPGTADARPIYVMQREVTNAEFAAFLQAMKDEGAERSPPRHWGAGAPAEDIAGQPVRWVSRADAIAYGEWKSRTDGVHYRLPEEAEWERAARGSGEAGGRPYPWGDDAERIAKVVATGAPADAGGNDLDATPEAVRGFGGNVAEWTAATDGGKAVVRGGCFDPWAKADPMARILVRSGAVALPTVGFRLVRDVK